MYVWRMKCTHFDYGFLHEIHSVLTRQQDKKVKIVNPAIQENGPQPSPAPNPTQVPAQIPQ